MQIFNPALLVSLGSMFFAGLTWVLAAKASRDIGPLKSLFLFQLIGIPIFIFLLPFAPHTNVTDWTVIIGTGIFQTFVMILLFYALQIGEAAVVLPATDFYAIITAILGIIFLHESLFFIKVLGMISVTVGIILLGLKFSELTKRKLQTHKGITPAVFNALGTGVFFFLSTISSRENGWFWTALDLRVVISLTAAVILIFRREDLTKIFRNVPWKYLLPSATFDVISFSLYNIGVSHFETSYVTIIFSAQSLISVALAYLFLKERLKIYQIAGVFVVIFGLILMQLK